LRLTKAVARDSASPVDPAAMHTEPEGQTSLGSGWNAGAEPVTN
jgi:hypothetical protein